MSASSESNGPLVQIRCPGCAQKFKIAAGLRGRMVECGTCEHQFRVEDEVIARVEKIFPGERRAAVAQFAKRAAPVAEPAPVRLDHAAPPLPGGSFWHLPIGGLGVMIILVVGTLFFIEAEWGFAQVGLAGRFAAVAVAAALATGCFLLANPSNRQRALLLGLSGLTVLLVLPLATPVIDPSQPQPDALDIGLPSSVREPEETHDEALQKMGYNAVLRTREEQRKAGGEAAAKRVMAVWLRGVKEVAKLEIKDFLIRIGGADLYSHLYPRRENGDFLMVLQGTQVSFEELQQSCLRLGRLGRVFQAEQAIELFVDELPFEAPSAALANPADPGFYALNLRELESIDLQRAGRAAERLGTAKPQKFRPDIVRRLIQLLGEGDAEFKGRVAQSLRVWSTPDDLAGDAGMRALLGLLHENQPIPEPLVALVVEKKIPDSLPIIDQLWRSDPVAWEPTYADAGAFAEETILKSFATTQGSLRQSAVRIIAAVGTAKSLGPLRDALQAGADPDLAPLLKKAIAAIEQRAH